MEKYKVELSGTVKVDGIKNRDDHLEQAEKHFKVEEYSEARNCLKNIISEVYPRHGFLSIETPTIERQEILLAHNCLTHH